MCRFSLTVSIEDLSYKDGNVLCVYRMNSTLGLPLLLKTCVLQMPKDIRDCVASGLHQWLQWKLEKCINEWCYKILNVPLGTLGSKSIPNAFWSACNSLGNTTIPLSSSFLEGEVSVPGTFVYVPGRCLSCLSASVVRWCWWNPALHI